MFRDKKYHEIKSKCVISFTLWNQAGFIFWHEKGEMISDSLQGMISWIHYIISFYVVCKSRKEYKKNKGKINQETFSAEWTLDFINRKSS